MNDTGRIGQTISLGIATVAGTLATLSLAFVATVDIVLPNATGLRLLFSLFGAGLIYAATLCIDWAIDYLGDAGIEELIRDPRTRNVPADLKDKDQMIARLYLFNHGYAVLCVSLALLMFLFLLQIALTLLTYLPENISLPGFIIFSGLAWVAPVLAALYVLYQVLTFEGNTWVTRLFGLFLVVLLLVFVFGLGSVFGPVLK